MSLLTSGPETLAFYPSVWGTDSKGNQKWLTGTVPAAIVAAQVNLSETVPVTVEGQQIISVYRVICLTVPDIGHARYARVDWNGKRFQIIGDVTEFRQGKRTQHVQFLMSEVSGGRRHKPR